MQTESTNAKAIAALKARQRAIASHYAQVSLDRERLEAEAIAQLKAKNPEDLNQ